MKTGILLYIRKDGRKTDDVERALTLVCAAAREKGLTVLIHPEKTYDIGLIIAIGGDGTFLDASYEALELDVPLAGVNAGSLGFLTEITPDEHDEIHRIMEPRVRVQERIVLAVSVTRDGRVLHYGSAVNELLIMRCNDTPMLDLGLRYAGMNLPHYKADGLIVATPTGSTAYNLSINGPILFPTEHAMVLNAVAPHALTNRPLVLPSNSELEIILGEEASGVLSIDGRSITSLIAGDRLSVQESSRMLKFVPSSRRTFFDVLARKLHFGRRD
ncbi:MAG TPA: NAD(+)/NADH kinase [bacterium]|nr:NAD(+)/NADH kinase [bacterium]